MANKKNKLDRHVKIHHWIWLLIMRIFIAPWIFLYFWYRPRLYWLKKRGPLLLLCNHTSEFDVVLFDTLFDFPVYFVGSDQLLNKGFGSALLRYFFNPIPISKSTSDMNVVPRIKRVMNQGGNVAIFPEGNSTMNGSNSWIPPATGKLIKLLKVPVVFFNSYGIYFSSPRWGQHRKFGPTGYRLKRIMEPEDYADMTIDQINDVVYQELSVNAYEQRPIHKYRGFKKAKGLHRLIFTCPKCQQPFNMHSRGNHLKCSLCDYDGLYDVYGYVNSQLGRHDLVTLDYQCKRDYVNYAKKHIDEISLNADVTIHYFAKDLPRSKPYPKHLHLNKEGLTISDQTSSTHYGFDKIMSYAIQVRTKLIVYIRDGESMFILFNKNISTYSYLISLQLFHNQYLLSKGETDYDLFADTGDILPLGL
jgi:1-acyl-sn-glycerol-3-phosphate acyltransferase